MPPKSRGSKRGHYDTVDPKLASGPSVGSHYSDYILQGEGDDKHIVRINPPKVGQSQKTKGHITPCQDILHLQNDFNPEPYDQVHTFKFEFPMPGVNNWIPKQKDDYLILPRITGTDVSVRHESNAVCVPGNKEKVGEWRGKTVAVWISPDNLIEDIRNNPDYQVKDINDLMLKYEPVGLKLFRCRGQKVSLQEHQDLDALGIRENTIVDALKNLEKMGGTETIRKTEGSKTSDGVHIWQWQMEDQPKPEYITTEKWTAENGQAYAQYYYVHVYLANGVWDPKSKIYFSVNWTLHKISASDWLWRRDYERDTRALISSGLYFQKRLNAYKDKLQIVYSCRGPNNDKGDPTQRFAWRIFVDGGRAVTYLAPSMYTMTALQSNPTDTASSGYRGEETVYQQDIDEEHPDRIEPIFITDRSRPVMPLPPDATDKVVAKTHEDIGQDVDTPVKAFTYYSDAGGDTLVSSDQLDSAPPRKRVRIQEEYTDEDFEEPEDTRRIILDDDSVDAVLPILTAAAPPVMNVLGPALKTIGLNAGIQIGQKIFGKVLGIDSGGRGITPEELETFIKSLTEHTISEVVKHFQKEGDMPTQQAILKLVTDKLSKYIPIADFNTKFESAWNTALSSLQTQVQYDAEQGDEELKTELTSFEQTVRDNYFTVTMASALQLKVNTLKTTFESHVTDFETFQKTAVTKSYLEINGIAVTPFKNANQQPIVPDQTVNWQLTYLFDTKADKSEVMTETVCISLISKKFAEYFKAAKPGEAQIPINQAALNSVVDDVTKLKEAMTSFQTGYAPQVTKTTQKANQNSNVLQEMKIAVQTYQKDVKDLQIGEQKIEALIGYSDWKTEMVTDNRTMGGVIRANEGRLANLEKAMGAKPSDIATIYREIVILKSKISTLMQHHPSTAPGGDSGSSQRPPSTGPVDLSALTAVRAEVSALDARVRSLQADINSGTSANKGAIDVINQHLGDKPATFSRTIYGELVSMDKLLTELNSDVQVLSEIVHKVSTAGTDAIRAELGTAPFNPKDEEFQSVWQTLGNQAQTNIQLKASMTALNNNVTPLLGRLNTIDQGLVQLRDKSTMKTLNGQSVTDPDGATIGQRVWQNHLKLQNVNVQIGVMEEIRFKKMDGTVVQDPQGATIGQRVVLNMSNIADNERDVTRIQGQLVSMQTDVMNLKTATTFRDNNGHATADPDGLSLGARVYDNMQKLSILSTDGGPIDTTVMKQRINTNIANINKNVQSINLLDRITRYKTTTGSPAADPDNYDIGQRLYANTQDIREVRSELQLPPGAPTDTTIGTMVTSSYEMTRSLATDVQRLDARVTILEGGSSDTTTMTDALSASKSHWYKNVAYIDVPLKLSTYKGAATLPADYANWTETQKKIKLKTILPFECNRDIPEDGKPWKNCTIRAHAGKNTMIISLMFLCTKDLPRKNIKYRIQVRQTTDREQEGIVVLSSLGVIDGQRNAYLSTHTINQDFNFHCLNRTISDSWYYVTFEWFEDYPRGTDIIELQFASWVYLVPIYYRNTTQPLLLTKPTLEDDKDRPSPDLPSTATESPAVAGNVWRSTIDEKNWKMVRKAMKISEGGIGYGYVDMNSVRFSVRYEGVGGAQMFAGVDRSLHQEGIGQVQWGDEQHEELMRFHSRTLTSGPKRHFCFGFVIPEYVAFALQGQEVTFQVKLTALKNNSALRFAVYKSANDLNNQGISRHDQWVLKDFNRLTDEEMLKKDPNSYVGETQALTQFNVPQNPPPVEIIKNVIRPDYIAANFEAHAPGVPDRYILTDQSKKDVVSAMQAGNSVQNVKFSIPYGYYEDLLVCFFPHYYNEPFDIVMSQEFRLIYGEDGKGVMGEYVSSLLDDTSITIRALSEEYYL